jgi:hypothetical protein
MPWGLTQAERKRAGIARAGAVIAQGTPAQIRGGKG